MPYQIEFTDTTPENFVIYWQQNEAGQKHLCMGINHTLTNPEGMRLGKSDQFDLPEEAKTQIANFLKPYMQEIGTRYGVNIPAWAQS